MDPAEFTYHLPPAAIAQRPLEPRDASRLLVVDGLEDRRFRDLPGLLQPGDLLVLNRTRVRRARLIGTKESGGRVEALLLRRLDGARWQATVRPARRLRPGTRIDFGPLEARVESVGAGVAVLALSGDGDEAEEALAAGGEVPLPPYITVPLDDAERYQTVYARELGSAAAPTAGLHFTLELLEEIAAAGIDITEIVLDIGLDTFRPITAARVEDHPIHCERYAIPPEAAAAVGRSREAGGRVVAVGTTVVRALESAATGPGLVAAGAGDTSLFIRPGYEFRVVDGLITNFHQPGTTLLVLLAALVPGWRAAYAHALGAGYRFLSFGDAMLVWRRSGDAGP